jgi:hypothetical protein
MNATYFNVECIHAMHSSGCVICLFLLWKVFKVHLHVNYSVLEIFYFFLIFLLSGAKSIDLEASKYIFMRSVYFIWICHISIYR